VNDHTHIGVTSLQRICNPRQHRTSSEYKLYYAKFKAFLYTVQGSPG